MNSGLLGELSSLDTGHYSFSKISDWWSSRLNKSQDSGLSLLYLICYLIQIQNSVLLISAFYSQSTEIIFFFFFLDMWLDKTLEIWTNQPTHLTSAGVAHAVCLSQFGVL